MNREERRCICDLPFLELKGVSIVDVDGGRCGYVLQQTEFDTRFHSIFFQTR